MHRDEHHAHGTRVAGCLLRVPHRGNQRSNIALAGLLLHELEDVGEKVLESPWSLEMLKHTSRRLDRRLDANEERSFRENVRVIRIALEKTGEVRELNTRICNLFQRYRCAW